MEDSLGGKLTMNLRINSPEANLRVTPNTSQAPLARLPVGHLVVALDEPQGSWRRCRTRLDNLDLEGFINVSLLRPEINPEVDQLVALAGKEFRHFLFGRRHESHPDSRLRIRDYWLSFSGSAQDAVRVPWSAAFISFVVKNASLSKFFAFDDRHTTYMSDSKRAKLASDSSRAYWAVRLNERQLQVGDLVGAYRTNSDCGFTVRTYDSLPGDFCSHCDFVVAIRGEKAITIGGNVSNTVRVTEVPLTAEGHAAAGGKRIAIMARNF
jgi:hypothetical protein